MARRIFALATLALLLWTVDASANCARPVDYATTVDRNTVTVRPANFEHRECGNGEVLLRENVYTRDVVALEEPCETDSPELRGWVDECVPAGSYRYGLETPYNCVRAACYTTYYAEARVTSELPSDCVAAALPAAGKAVPWGIDPEVCSYGGPVGPSPAPPFIFGWLVTVAVESPLVALFYGRARWRMALVAAVATSMTNLIMNTVLPLWLGTGGAFLLVGEASALVLEAATYAVVARPRNVGRAVMASAVANTASFLVGLWLPWTF